jgi:uncharacterized membrane protein YeaQ/YmgE (transglycosylase-associated protein family)
MEILYLVLIGAVVGVLARLFMPGSDPIGIVGTLVVGIVGAVLGGYLWREIFGNTKGIEWIGAVVTAMLVLFVYRRLTYGRRTTAL